MRDKYSYSPYRYSTQNERGAGLTVLKIIMPLLAVGIVALGAYLAYRDYVRDNPEVDYPNSQTEESVYSDEQSQLLLSVVNENAPLAADYVPQLVQSGDVYVNPLAQSGLESLLSAAKADGQPLSVLRGYVSFEEQQTMNKAEQERLQSEMGFTPVKAEAEAKKTVPPAGCCESQTGLLIEFGASDSDNFTESGAYNWLLRNANEYGFIQRYPDFEEEGREGLFRFVGVENAIKIRSFGMTLDEYSDYLAQK